MSLDGNSPRESVEDAYESAEADDTYESSDRAVAVVGMAGRFPQAPDLDSLWTHLEQGVEAIRELSDDELEAAGVPPEVYGRDGYVKAASVLDGVELFDADFFGYNPREAAILDPQQRLFLEQAWAAMESSGHAPSRFDGLVGVYAGVAWNTYLLSNLMTRPELFDGAGAFQVFITSDKDFMPTRLSYKLNLKGPSVLMQTSCSTSLVATHMACLALQSYECDMALVGGSTVKVPGNTGYFYEEGGLASPDGHCRAFDARAAGTVFGSGVGVVALRRLSDALADGDPIRAVILGSAINNDGSMKVSYTAPSVEGQAEVIAAAQEMAAVDPETIRYVECHGTGTKLGDPIEVRALSKVFQEKTDAEGFCALGSIKTNVGHLDAAAGVAGLIKTTLALEKGRIPPSLHFETPNPAIDFDGSPFYVAAEAADWPRGDGPRRAAVSSFGVGGTNAHAVLEQAPEPYPTDDPARRWQILPMSARNEAALDAVRGALAGALTDLDGDPAHRLADAAFTLADGRETFRRRAFVVAESLDEAASLVAGESPGRLWTAEDVDEPRRRAVAFLFPGQGSQYLGMAGGLYDSEPYFREVVDRCADTLEPLLDFDLRRVIVTQPGDDGADEVADALARTRLTQPALFVVEYALARWWQLMGVEPQAMLGHSIGEFVAAAVAGVMSEEDALRLVAERARLMDGLPTGDMIAVPMGEPAAVAWLEDGSWSDRVAVAVINEAERTVLSGDPETVAGVTEALTADGIDVRPLHTSHAFHSPAMEPILEAFEQAVAKVELSAPKIPFVSNVTGTWITDSEATDPGYWVRHLRRAVRFADGLADLCEAEDRIFLEVGPGRTLTTLAGRHPRRSQDQPTITCLRHPREAGEGDREDSAALLTAFGLLWLAGHDVDPAILYRGEDEESDERRRRLSLPTYAFQRQRYWIDPRPRQAYAEGDELRFDDGLGKEPMDRWLSVPTWSRTLELPSTDEPLLCCILGAAEGLGGELAERVRRAGGRAALVDVGAVGSGLQKKGHDLWTLDPLAQTSAVQELLRDLGSEPDEPPKRLTLVHAWTYGFEPQGFEDAHGRALGPVLSWVQAFAALDGVGSPVSGLDLLVVGDRLSAVVAGERLEPSFAPLLGLFPVISQEWPTIRCRSVDLRPGRSTPSEAAELIWAEALDLARRSDHGDASRVAQRAGERWLESTLALPGDPSLEHASGLEQAGLKQGGSYLITGGTRSNGYAIARLLARDFAARLVLVDAEADDGVEGGGAGRARALGELGAERVIERRFDTTAVEPWRALLAELDGLDGVIHAASTYGESTFRTLAEIDAEHLKTHFDAKIRTLTALDRALQESATTPRLHLLLGSLATRLGGLAYGAYAAANAYLEAFAQSRRQSDDGLPWRVVSWDVWQFGERQGEKQGEKQGEGDAELQITALRDDLAALAMTPEEGEKALLRVIAAGRRHTHVLVSTADLEARRRAAGRRSAPAAADGKRHPRPTLQTAYAAPETELQERIADVWGAHLGFEGIGLDDNFFDLGGDSFIAVRVAAGLREALEVDLPVAQLYERLTVRSLAELLAVDAAGAQEERAKHLEERRESMGKRQAMLRRRRGRRARGTEEDAGA